MNQMPLVSIIIPTYNSETTCENAILSVLNQTYPNVECIIIDGKSIDNTLQILEKYKDKLKIISEKDNGIYDAMNKGLTNSSGEWVLFLGSDDVLYPTGIDKLVESSDGYDAVYGNTTLISPKGDRRNYPAKHYSVIPKHSASIHQSTMVRKSVLLSLGGFDLQYKFLADYDMTLRIYLSRYKFKQIDAYISYYSMGGASAFNMRCPIERYKIHKNNKSMSFPLLYFVKDYLFFFLYGLKYKVGGGI